MCLTRQNVVNTLHLEYFFLLNVVMFLVLDNIDPSEFVRHLLIESTPKGVHLKDCKDEPMFGKKLFSRYKALFTL